MALLLIGALAATGLQPAARVGWAGGSIRMDFSLARDHALQRARDAVAHAAAQLVLSVKAGTRVKGDLLDIFL